MLAKVIEEGYRVAPFAGAWIETVPQLLGDYWQAMSLPSRERGLKHYQSFFLKHRNKVAPFAGAWIETSPMQSVVNWTLCRSLRGSVD